MTWAEWKWQVEALGIRAANCLYEEALKARSLR